MIEKLGLKKSSNLSVVSELLDFFEANKGSVAYFVSGNSIYIKIDDDILKITLQETRVETIQDKTTTTDK